MIFEQVIHILAQIVERYATAAKCRCGGNMELADVVL